MQTSHVRMSGDSIARSVQESRQIMKYDKRNETCGACAGVVSWCRVTEREARTAADEPAIQSNGGRPRTRAPGTGAPLCATAGRTETASSARAPRAGSLPGGGRAPATEGRIHHPHRSSPRAGTGSTPAPARGTASSRSAAPPCPAATVGNSGSTGHSSGVVARVRTEPQTGGG